MKILGLMPNKREEKEIKKLIEEIIFYDNYTELFETLKEVSYEVLLIWSDELNAEILIELIKRVKEINADILIYVLGEKASMNLVAGAISAGAIDYILKPYDVQKLYQSLEKEMKKLHVKDTAKQNNCDIMLGSTKEMVSLYKNIGRISTNNQMVFIIGENGTGKELLAKIIHSFNRKKTGEFVVLNTDLGEYLDKRLFGEELYEGSNLIEIKKSYLEKALNGTLLIKEVGDLTLDSQIKLLEFIDNGSYSRINGKEKLISNVRVIFSSTRNLEELVEKGRFCEELWEKIKGNSIYIPPLRERKDDILELINYFIEEFNNELNLNIKDINKTAINKILKYNWPNNVKELKMAIKASMALARNEYISVEDLPAQVIGTKISKRYGDVHDWVLADWIEGELDTLEKSSEGNYCDSLVSRVERELIRQVLEKCNGKKVETAELLGITRTTLRTKMNSYGLD